MTNDFNDVTATAGAALKLRRILRHAYFRSRSFLDSAKIKKTVGNYLITGAPLRLIVGSGGLKYPGWIATDMYTLNILKSEDWERFLRPATVDRLLAEHVLEHLDLEQNRRVLSLAYHYLKPGGVFRIAVPDGNRRDAFYVSHVAPPVDGHRILFTLESLGELLVSAGFEVEPLEYFDSEETFNSTVWASDDGHVNRSVRYDRQESMRRGNLCYTSLIVDARKPV
jgi:predicted SAM-dependent methyltransferase